ncbi:phospholipase-like protein [Tanacetum coccineum]
MDNSHEIFEAKISVRSKLRYLQKIKSKLQPFPNRYMMFRDSVFGPWLNLKDFSNDNHMLNYVLQHQVHVKEFSADCPPILFKISNHYHHFGREEFCLVTGFRCVKVKELWQIIDNEKLWCALDDEDAVRTKYDNEKLWCALDDEDAVRVVDYVNVVEDDCTLVEQTKKPSCSNPDQVDAVINRGVPLVQRTPHVLRNVVSSYKGLVEPKIIDTVDLLCKQLIDVRPEMEGMFDQLKLKVIHTLTTTLESERKHAEVVDAEVVNCETNLVECPLVEKDIGVLRVAVDSSDMNLVDCPVVHKENSEPKHFTFTDTHTSTMKHLVNACAFVSHPFPFYDILKADKCIEPPQDTNDTDDDYMDFENNPSQYCLDNMTIGIEEDTQNGELTHTEKMGLRGEDKQIANENSDFDTLLKDGNMNLDKLIADVTKSKNKSVLRRNCKRNPTKVTVPTCMKSFLRNGVRPKQLYKFPWVNYGIVVDEHFWLALLGLDENRTGWLTHGLSLVFGDPLQTALAYREHEPPVDELSRWAAAKVSKRNRKSANWIVTGIEHMKMYHVKDHKAVHVIDLSKGECSCRKWQLLGLPCGHVCAVSRVLNMSNSNRWAKAWFSRRTLKATYEQLVYPLPDVMLWVTPNDLQVVLPPALVKP